MILFKCFAALCALPARAAAWLMDWWHARQRAIDLRILWPICCEQASDLDHAQAAFAYHAYNDPAWLCLGRDEIYRIITNLRPPGS